MKKTEYLKRALDAYNSGKVTEEVYDAMVLNADYFCDEDDEDEYDSFLPKSYAEIEYYDLDTPEALAGCKFDDMNFLRYLER